MVVSGFPVLSQTFVALQLAELVRRGHRVSVYCTGQRGEVAWLPAGIGDQIANVRLHYLDTYEEDREKNFFLLPKLIYLLARRPLGRGRTLKKVLKKHGFEVFSRLISDAYLMRGLSKSDVVHFQFVNLVHPILKMKELGFIDDTPKWVCSARGFDITKEKHRNPAYWPRIFGGVDRFLPVCRSLEVALRQKGCKKPISVVRSPVNVDHIESAQKPRPRGRTDRAFTRAS